MESAGTRRENIFMRALSLSVEMGISEKVSELLWGAFAGGIYHF
jgi:hypothetical protein